jgi:hypothetical protein
MNDDALFKRYEELLEEETYLTDSLKCHRGNVTPHMTRDVLVHHRITCDAISEKLRRLDDELKFTERLIGARFQLGKLNLEVPHDE